MTSILEQVLGSLDSLAEAYTSRIVEPSKELQHIQDLVTEEGGYIYNFTNTHPLQGFTLGAVDGGNGNEKLSTGDLIIAAATFAEGMHPSVYVDGKEPPTEVYSTIMPHFSSNEKIERAMRALMEMRILTQAETNMRIIDGSYLGNISNIIYALIDPDSRVSNEVLMWEMMKDDGFFQQAAQELLYPSRGTDNYIIGVPKSDSSTYYVDHLFAKYGLKNTGMTDRLFASTLLQPGEFIKPRNIESVPALVSTLEKSLKIPDFGKDSLDKPSLMKIVHDKAGLLRRIGLNPTEEGLLWTTYFKPSSWESFSPVVRIEFLFYENDSNMTVQEKAAEIIATLDKDFVGPTILEPWCQYVVDREAKGVSQALTATREFLLSQVEDARGAMGLLRGYRT